MRSGSLSGIVLRIAVSTGLMNLYCSGVITEKSAVCMFLLIEKGDSFFLVTLRTYFVSSIVEIESEDNRLAASVNVSTGVTVPVVFHCDEWSTNAVIVFVVIGGTVILSWMRTT